jgi:hypothetical protein
MKNNLVTRIRDEEYNDEFVFFYIVENWEYFKETFVKKLEVLNDPIPSFIDYSGTLKEYYIECINSLLQYNKLQSLFPDLLSQNYKKDYQKVLVEYDPFPPEWQEWQINTGYDKLFQEINNVSPLFNINWELFAHITSSLTEEGFNSTIGLNAHIFHMNSLGWTLKSTETTLNGVTGFKGEGGYGYSMVDEFVLFWEKGK